MTIRREEVWMPRLLVLLVICFLVISRFDQYSKSTLSIVQIRDFINSQSQGRALASQSAEIKLAEGAQLYMKVISELALDYDPTSLDHKVEQVLPEFKSLSRSDVNYLKEQINQELENLANAK